ncbi:sugar ABC transporter permease [Acholeplasma equirhinis]|uniref:carbohydrate ABC transporter permease n=1 Tax=Acholeplasma equirhinis TaxID=555393 RepID=UPI00197A8ED0|nr:sugar ABC transporter permease [Acholeplasma equirhinis]MBN3490764.1 sugar ABC transporter permease [Acholeplasma equirhinis]
MQAQQLNAPKKKLQLTYDQQKTIWAIIFLLPWLAGLILLFLKPFIESLRFSFFNLTPQIGYIAEEFVGFENYLFALNSHTTTNSSFRLEILNTMSDALFNLPVLLIFSLFIAVLLNMKFKGRGVVRAIFFIPVILNSVAVTAALGGGDAISQILEQQGISKLFDLEFYLLSGGIPDFLVGFIVGLIGRIYDILALSGVPILLFLASIQSIPGHLYEAAKIEGATPYEMFWLITLPNVTPHIITVTIYALVDTFMTSTVSTIISDTLAKQQWGLASAMAWIYVGVVLLLLVVIFILAKIFKIGDSHYEH